MIETERPKKNYPNGHDRDMTGSQTGKRIDQPSPNKRILIDGFDVGQVRDDKEEDGGVEGDRTIPERHKYTSMS